jgi:hypothetical protein
MMENRRIGEYLIDDKRITPQQLQQALATQTERAQIGTKPLLGSILMEMGWLNSQDLAFALESQEREKRRMH